MSRGLYGVASALATTISQKRHRKDGKTYKDVDTLSAVAEPGHGVFDGSGTDSYGFGGGGGRVLTGVHSVVSSGNGKENTGANGGVDSLVERRRAATAQRHIGNALGLLPAFSTLGNSSGVDTGSVVVDYPLDTADNITQSTSTV